MATTNKIIKKILHYQRSIKRNQSDEERLLHCIKKLHYLPINIEILQETGIDKTVNSIRKFGGNFDQTVETIVSKWNEMLSGDVNLAKSNGQGNDGELKKKSRSKCCKVKKRKRNSSKHTEVHDKTNKRQRIDHVTDKFEDSLELRPIDSKVTESSVAGFAMAEERKSSITSTITSNGPDDFEKDDSNILKLDLLSSTYKLEPLNFNIVTDFSAPILTNYNPKPKENKQTVMKNSTLSSDNHSFDESKVFLYGISSKSTRTKVFSGVKSRKLIQPASLLDSCRGVLQKHIGELKNTNNVPFSILKPVLERATPEQLLKLEDYNPYLLEDSDLLWHMHVKRYYCTKHRQEMETWREMFLRCQDEKNKYLNKLTEKYNQKKLNATPVRKIQLANDDSMLKTKGVKRQPIAHSKAKPIAGDAHLPLMETFKSTKNDLMGKPPGRTAKRMHDSGDKAKPVVKPAAPVAGVNSDTKKETKLSDVRQRMIDVFKNSKEGRSTTKRPKKAPLMEKTLKYIRTLNQR